MLNKDARLLKAAIISLSISSFSLFFSFFGSYSGNVFNLIMALMTGIFFWLGLIVGYMLLAIINFHRKCSKNSLNQKSKPGIICIFSNKYAVVADIAMVLFLILSLLFLFIPPLSKSIAIVFVSIFLFSLHMHCILNGVNFRYINSVDKKERDK